MAIGLNQKFKFGKYGPKKGNHMTPKEVIDSGNGEYLEFLFNKTHHTLSRETWAYYEDYKKHEETNTKMEAVEN